MKKKYLANAALSIVYVLAYALPLAAFVLLMAITNPQILRISRTTAITISSFCVLMFVFSRIYGGFRIGQQKSRPIIYQMSLSMLFSDIVAYIQLQIMNVNAANNDSLEIFTIDLLLLLLALCVQVFCITVLAYLGNYIYFSVRPPKKCCVITANARDRRAICAKIGVFRKQFVINECVDC